MAKRFILLIGGLFTALLANSALADVLVVGNIDKQKTITVTESVLTDYLIGIYVLGLDEFLGLDGAAEAEAIVNAANFANEAYHLPAEDGTDQGKDIREVQIGSTDGGGEALSGNEGILGVNIDVGNMTNQANVVSIAVTESASAVTDAQAAAEQLNVDNFAANFGTPESPPSVDAPDGTITTRVGVERTLAVGNSMNSNGGVVLLNLNAGDMNNQANTVALAVGEGGYVALSEADLGQVNVDSFVWEDQTISKATIVNSMNGGQGVVGINQSSGNLNNQASAVSIAATASSVNLPGLSFGQ